MGVVALTLKLIYSHCLIRFNISSENNDFGFNSILEMQSEANLILMLSRSRTT